MTDYTTSSASELAAAQAAIQREVQRREQMDAEARAEAFKAELQEVRDGTRALRDEHVAWLSPKEVLAAVNSGQVPGVGADRRLSRRR